MAVAVAVAVAAVAAAAVVVMVAAAVAAAVSEIFVELSPWRWLLGPEAPVTGSPLESARVRGVSG